MTDASSPDTGADPKPATTSDVSVETAQQAPAPMTATAEDIKGKAREVEDDDDDDDGEDEDEEEEEEDEEPRLKYVRLTQHLGSVYRADATSTFLVAGDKMIVGTHGGNIYVVQLPSFQTISVYHAHSASVTSISISPFPPPLSTLKPDAIQKAAAAHAASAGGSKQPATPASPAAASRKSREPPPILNIPSNNIYIATSSVDGNVCVQGLIDRKDVQLRNFARPIQAVALSPDYKNDRTYLSGGLAGNLILTTGGALGKSNSTTIGTAAATAQGWLGSIGLGTNTGKDTVLHSGEGTISTIKWSLTGRYVVWLNEHGFKIMRTKIKLDSADAEDAWKRIGHIDRPQTEEWETMASAWKGRAEWIDEQAVEADDDQGDKPELAGLMSPAAEKLKQQQSRHDKAVEKLVVGWGGTIWIVHVHPGGAGVGKNVGERSSCRAEIHQKLRMDCIISGISLYTQNLLLVLAYCLPEDEEEDEEESDNGKKAELTPTKTRGHQRQKPSTASSSSEPSGGIRRRQNNQPPEIRLIDLRTQAEVYMDGLSVSRFERLGAGDYHLGVLPARNAAAVASSKGALEAIAGFGTDMWNAAINPKMLFSSGASIKSKDSNDGASGISKLAGSSITGSVRGAPSGGFKVQTQSVHPNLDKPGSKIFIHSPYDCILATKRDLGDHLAWLVEHQEYQQAWELVDEHPEIVTITAGNLSDLGPSTPIMGAADKDKPGAAGPHAATQSSDDFFLDDASSTLDSTSRAVNSLAAREKRRIGELWMQDLVEEGDWRRAGEVAAKVLVTADRWEKWIWAFAGANRFDEIAPYMPTERLRPPLKSAVYEVVLGHYIQDNKPRFRELLDRWGPELFDVSTVATALENQLTYRDVREDSVEDGERGRDWRIVMESLARLHEASGRHRDALRCYIRLQDADAAFRLIRDSHLADAVADDIPRFISLRVPSSPPGAADRMSLQELEEATSEAITLLVDEAQHGLVKPEVVVSQLQEKDLDAYLFFYLRGLWNGDGIRQQSETEIADRLRDESRALVDDFADLAVRLFAAFDDRPLLMELLEKSASYSFEKAAQECEANNFVPELVYLYAKTGQMKRALYLIIDRLADVSRAIAFAKTQDDPDLWADLLDYSMDKPRFIRGLLEEVGTAIDPITLVRRIPEGLEIPGLREGLTHIMREHEIQHSISSGVARVLRSEVAAAQATLRAGQRRGVKFEVVVGPPDGEPLQQQPPKASGSAAAAAVPSAAAAEHAAGAAAAAPPAGGDGAANEASSLDDDAVPRPPSRHWTPGHCARCLAAFTEWEMETLVGFACGHVFHLSHLLQALHPGEEAEPPPAPPPEYGEGGGGGGGEWVGGRLYVGAKVTHARLLRDRVRGGCPLCPKVSKELLYV